MPSVDQLARALANAGNSLPHALLVEVARDAISARDPASAPGRARALERTMLRRVINATGVLLHTNLGRAPTRPHDDPYSSLEIDIETGRRGARGNSIASLMRPLTGAEDVLVVNNGAAAILLVLAALASGSGVVVSRGQLVEIGGGVRIPDLLKQSGADLVEVGTTNITRAADYARALAENPDDVAAFLVVHQSNFEVRGFAGQPSLREVAAIGPPVIVDLGSGLLDASTPWLPGMTPPWLGREPAVRQTLADGAVVVTFSADKLLGGPQAGLIVGRRDLIAECRSHPLARAVRPGRMILRGLEQTLLAYLEKDLSRLPFWQMATLEPAAVEQRARDISHQVGGRVVPCVSVPGGGTTPGEGIPSFGLAVAGDVTTTLRRADPPILARVHNAMTVCDLRTVDPSDDSLLAKALQNALSNDLTSAKAFDH